MEAACFDDKLSCLCRECKYRGVCGYRMNIPCFENDKINVMLDCLHFSQKE